MKKENIGFGGEKLIIYLKNLEKKEHNIKKQIIKIKEEKKTKLNKIQNNFNRRINPLERKANNLLKKRLNILKEYNCFSPFIPKLILTKEQLDKDINEFHSVKKIANKYNVSSSLICRWLFKFGYKSSIDDSKDYIKLGVGDKK